MGEEGSSNGASLSEESVRRASREGSFTGTLEDMLRRAPDRDMSLHRGPFMSEGNLESGGGWYTGDCKWRLEGGCGNGTSLCEGTACGGPGWRAPLLGTLKGTLSKAVEWASVCIGAVLLGIVEVSLGL
jgi:hypothetical protein